MFIYFIFNPCLQIIFPFLSFVINTVKRGIFMYRCHECKNEFSTPETATETHGLQFPPYETYSLCPICKSTDIEEITYFCKCCGARLKENTEYCSEHCRARGEAMLKREQKNKEFLENSPILKTVRAADEYNRTHGTNLTYGQYAAFIEPVLKKQRKIRK